MLQLHLFKRHTVLYSTSSSAMYCRFPTQTTCLLTNEKKRKDTRSKKKKSKRENISHYFQKPFLFGFSSVIILTRLTRPSSLFSLRNIQTQQFQSRSTNYPHFFESNESEWDLHQPPPKPSKCSIVQQGQRSLLANDRTAENSH